jgi:hypothetical protein
VRYLRFFEPARAIVTTQVLHLATIIMARLNNASFFVLHVYNPDQAVQRHMPCLGGFCGFELEGAIQGQVMPHDLCVNEKGRLPLGLDGSPGTIRLMLPA